MRQSKIINFTLYMFSFLVIAPVFFLSYFNFPSADDFSYGVNPGNLSFFEIQIERYLNWTSRYFATLILILSPIAFGSVKFYGIYTIIFLILFFFSIRKILKSLYVKSNYSINLLSMVIVSIFTLIVPSLCENYYWLPGSSTYFLPSIIFLFTLSVCIDIYNGKQTKGVYFLPLYVFIIGGTSEIIVGYTAMMLALFNFLYYLKFKKISNTLFLSFVLICIATLFIIFAPGNLVRNEISVSNLSLTDEITMILKKIVVINLRYLLYSFVFFLAVNKLFNIKLRILPQIKIIYIVAVLNGVLFLGAFVAIHSLGFLYPPRVENLLVFIGCIGTFLISYKVHEKIQISPKYLLAFSLPVIIIYFSIPVSPFDERNNIKLMYSDIFSGKTIKFKEELEERGKLIKNCKGHCEVPVLKYHPRSFYFKDMTSDPENYINHAEAMFYGLESIKAVGFHQ